MYLKISFEVVFLFRNNSSSSFGPIVHALQAGWQEKRSVKEMPFATKPECNEQKAKERWWIQHAEKSRDRKIAAGRKILAYIKHCNRNLGRARGKCPEIVIVHIYYETFRLYNLISKQI